jgi:hypothetical protein
MQSGQPQANWKKLAAVLTKFWRFRWRVRIIANDSKGLTRAARERPRETRGCQTRTGEGESREYRTAEICLQRWPKNPDFELFRSEIHHSAAHAPVQGYGDRW